MSRGRWSFVGPDGESCVQAAIDEMLTDER